MSSGLAFIGCGMGRVGRPTVRLRLALPVIFLPSEEVFTGVIIAEHFLFVCAASPVLKCSSHRV